MITPTDTTMNAVSVPMDTMSARLSSGTKPARIDETIATMTVLVTGVIVLGFTFANSDGSSPSRPIANRMRVWPYIVTSVTEKIEITAPAARIVLAQVPSVTLSRITARPASSCPSAEVLPRLGAEPGERDEHVDAGDDHQRGDDGARHGLLRVLDLVAGGRHGVKADEGEEDRARGRG